MNQLSDLWENFCEKIKPVVQKIKERVLDAFEWAKANKKKSVPAAAVVLVVLVVVLSLSFSRKSEDAQADGTETTEVELSPLIVPEVPLEENSVAAVNKVINRYYEAVAAGDVDTLSELTNSLADMEKANVQVKSEYIERYENIICYTKAGMTPDSYLVFAYSEAKIKDIDTTAPLLNNFVLYKNQSGDYYIYKGELDDNVFNYLKEISAQDDVATLCATVEAKYNQAIKDDEDLAAFMEEFPQKLKDAEAKAVAEQATEEPQEEEPEADEQIAEEPTLKVTEVETSDTVNVRSSDSEKADKIGKVPKGVRLPLLEKKANGWSKIQYEGQEAYIKSEYLLDVINNEQETAETDNTASETTTQTETASETKKESNGPVGKDGKITAKTTVNVRASASENGERLGVIYQGEKLELVMEQADGWCKVKYKGKTGYVKTEFVE